MRSALVYLAVGLITIASSAAQTGAQWGHVRTIHGFLGLKKNQWASTFSADVPTIYAYWKGEALAVGDTIRVTWIAEDVGDARGENVIRSAQTNVYKPAEVGSFSLSRPSGQNWPIGKYRVEFYLNGFIAEILKFTITPGVTIQVR